jgi:hypothetical protein
MEWNLQFYRLYSISYNFQKFKLNFEFELNKYELNYKKALCIQAASTVARPSRFRQGPTHFSISA